MHQLDDFDEEKRRRISLLRPHVCLPFSAMLQYVHGGSLVNVWI